MSTPSGTITLKLDGSELLSTSEAPGGTSSQRTLRTGGYGLDKVALTSVSTPKIDQPLVAMLLTLTSGSPTTIDLTAVQGLAIPIGSTRTIDLTGAKVTAYLFETDQANTGVVTIEDGASNPYQLWAGQKLSLGKGRVEAGAFKGIASQLAAVAAGAKTIKVSTTVTGDKLYLELWAGT
jgi:hypothetical protein